MADVRRALRGAARFCLDLLVGDDRFVAAIVGAALAGTWVLVLARLPAWWLVPVAVVLATALALRRALAAGEPRE